MRYAYVAGARWPRGIASADLVILMGWAQLLSYYGSGGQKRDTLDRGVKQGSGVMAVYMKRAVSCFSRAY